MAKRKKVESRILTLTALCGICKKEVSLAYDDVYFYGSSQECELCGSHGDVTMDATCPECDKTIEVEVACW